MIDGASARSDEPNAIEAQRDTDLNLEPARLRRDIDDQLALTRAAIKQMDALDAYVSAVAAANRLPSPSGDGKRDGADKLQ